MKMIFEYFTSVLSSVYTTSLALFFHSCEVKELCEMCNKYDDNIYLFIFCEQIYIYICLFFAYALSLVLSSRMIYGTLSFVASQIN